jgi:hypothetical protein
MIQSPVFLVGAERSGTTLLRLMLSHHPLIAFANEFEIVVDLVGPQGRFPSREAFVDHLRKDRSFQLKRLEINPELDFVALANDLLDQYRRRKAQEPRVVGATVHRHFDRLLYTWPDARFIHIVRDGRDVALSTIPMGWHGNIYSGIGLWVEAEELWHRIASKIAPDRYHTIHFEALVGDTQGELTKLCAFLGVEYDPAMLTYEESTTYAKADKGNRNKWSKLDPVMVADAESAAAHWLIANGYELSQPARPVSAARKAYYRAQDRWARIRHMQRHYSFGLWLESIVSRRIGTDRWRESVRLRTHAITNQRIKK